MPGFILRWFIQFSCFYYNSNLGDEVIFFTGLSVFLASIKQRGKNAQGKVCSLHCSTVVIFFILLQYNIVNIN